MKGKKASGPELFKFIGADCFAAPCMSFPIIVTAVIISFLSLFVVVVLNIAKYVHIMQQLSLPPYNPAPSPAPSDATTTSEDGKENKADST
jgi:hypothetical protein